MVSLQTTLRKINDFPADLIQRRRDKRRKRLIDEKGKQLLVASQWQLIRWKFARHKLAMASLFLLGIMYLAAIFAEFVSPYDPRSFREQYAMAPPQRIRFFDPHEGRFHLRPFVYSITRQLDPDTWQVTFEEDRTEKQFIRFFVRGSQYRLMNIPFLEGNLRLFGVEEGIISLLGNDTRGRDLFSRIVHGSRISLTVGLLGIAISFFVGVLIGGLSGYFGGLLDVIIQRVIEAIKAIPTIPLWMALSVALPIHWPLTRVYFFIVLILSIIGWTGVARVVRGKFLSLRTEDFVTAAELDGASTGRLIFRYMLPSFYSYVIARLTLEVPAMILGETALSFLGLGLQAPAISWGVMLKDAQHIRVLANAPWMLLPGLFVFIAILAFNFVGDGLRDAADPYSNI
ncbi:MAG: ABC transporter permease [Spirochaetaceae bacterium]|nr:MAG: ABC transporter permease [Spirochaetaceae bacterium]